jgi:hypothetical protein
MRVRFPPPRPVNDFIGPENIANNGGENEGDQERLPDHPEQFAHLRGPAGSDPVIETGAIQGVFHEDRVGRSVPVLQCTQVQHRPALDFEWCSDCNHLAWRVDLQEAPFLCDFSSISKIAPRQTAQSQSDPR